MHWNWKCLSHLIANNVNVLLNLRHPLSEDSKQLWYSGAGVLKNPLAARIAWIKEGELWG